MNFLTASSMLFPPLKGAVSRRLPSRSTLMRAMESISPNGYFEANSMRTFAADSSLDVTSLFTGGGTTRTSRTICRKSAFSFIDCKKTPAKRLFASDPTNRTVQRWEMRNPFIHDKKKIKKSIRETEKILALFQRLKHHLQSMKPAHSARINELYKNTMFSLGLDDKEYKVLR